MSKQTDGFATLGINRRQHRLHTMHKTL